MTKNQILKKLKDAGYNMAWVIDCSRNYLEVFTGDACDYEENERITSLAAEITGLNHSVNIAYGGHMLSNEEFKIDTGNCL